MVTKSNCGSRSINRDSVDRREMFPKFLASLDCLIWGNMGGLKTLMEVVNNFIGSMSHP